MLGNCEKMSTPPISSTTNDQWPQNRMLNDQTSFMASSSSANMEKSRSQDPVLAAAHQQSLKCPRCDSSNTKFCYYNNYSLSQPRHFCKACKRYWTRGGTLRNVPVGGGCRKNKRMKRPQPPSSNGGDGSISPSSASAASTATLKQPSVQPEIDLSSNPLFYGLPTNPLELNFPFSRFSTTRVSSNSTGFIDHQPQMNGFGIGFSSGIMASELQDTEYKNGFKQIQDGIITSTNSSSPLLSDNINPFFLGSSTFAPTSTMATLLASTFQQQKFESNGLKDVQEANFPGLMPYDQANQMPGGNGVKIEGENGLEWNPNPNQITQINSNSDPSSLLWNTTNVGSWFDPSNMGSSVPSLI